MHERTQQEQIDLEAANERLAHMNLSKPNGVAQMTGGPALPTQSEPKPARKPRSDKGVPKPKPAAAEPGTLTREQAAHLDKLRVELQIKRQEVDSAQHNARKAAVRGTMPTKMPTKKQLEELRIYNPHNLASLTNQKVFISWSPQMTGRAYRSAHYAVIHIGHKTDPGGHWMDDGHKTFSIYGGEGEDKDSRLQQAIAWANERFGSRVWVRDPWGSYQDPSVIGLAWSALKAKKGANG